MSSLRLPCFISSGHFTKFTMSIAKVTQCTTCSRCYLIVLSTSQDTSTLLDNVLSNFLTDLHFFIHSMFSSECEEIGQHGARKNIVVASTAKYAFIWAPIDRLNFPTLNKRFFFFNKMLPLDNKSHLFLWRALKKSTVLTINGQKTMGWDLLFHTQSLSQRKLGFGRQTDP